MADVIKFLGASVIGVTSNLGWNSSSSSTTVSLVEDLRAGDKFVLANSPDPYIGLPVTFIFGQKKFRGLVGSWKESDSHQGNPTYEVNIVDPREILIGTKLILNGYYGTTNNIPNLINVFGFCEQTGGFGASEVNSGGMPWLIIKQSLIDIINNGVALGFGGKLYYRDISIPYTIDLSNIPVPPFFYRISGQSASLLDVINVVCEDAGCDYYVTLEDDNSIKINTVSRKLQIAYNNGPNSGSINKYITQQNTAFESKTRGWELRNDGPTSKFLVGAQVSELRTFYNDGTSIFPYFGKDVNGNHIYAQNLKDSTSVILNSVSCETFIGDFYPCSIGEMRIGAAGETNWISYICLNRPDVAFRCGFYDPIGRAHV